jgi:hypothetical protein
MTVENENFFDFFGIAEEQFRRLYAKGGKILYAPEIHVPVPKNGIPESGLKAMGLTVVTEKNQNSVWLDICLWISIVVLIVTIVYVIWKLTEPDPILEIQKEDSVEENA